MAPASGQVTINYTFTAGTIIDPDQVNDNFNNLSTKALNRQGGTVTGAIASSGGSLTGSWAGSPTWTAAHTFSAAGTAVAITNNATIGGTLGVTGATTLSSTLAVTTSVSTPSLITGSGALTITPAAGSNLNVALSTTGDFAVNTDDLYVDTSTGNVGIGTTSPAAMLSVGTGSIFQVSSAGIVSTTGFGTHSFSAGGTGGNTLTVRNPTAGTGNYSAFYLSTDTTQLAVLEAYSSTFTSSGSAQASGVAIGSQGSGGLSVFASHASGAIRLYTAGTEWWRINSSGGLLGGSSSDQFIGMNTTDGSDNRSLTIGGAAGPSQTRGAYGIFYGNENANPGFVRLLVGNVAGAEFEVYNAAGTTMLNMTGSDGSATFTSSANGLTNTWNFGNTAADPSGIQVNYNNVAPNNTTNRFFWGVDSSATRFEVRSNGGIANYQANDVNLSDARMKRNFRQLDIAAVWSAHKAMRDVWCLYDLIDQTHQDPNVGYTAQRMQEVWSTAAPWLVDTFDEESGRLGVYDHDLNNLTGAVVTELQWRSDDHEARIAKLEARIH